MTTDTPKDETPQDYPVTIERIDLPEDLPQDNPRASYTVIPQVDPDELSRMRALLRETQAKWRRPYPAGEDRLAQEEFWARQREGMAELEAILNGWTRDKKMALLQTMLKPGTEITIQPTDRWLDMLLLYNPGVLAEAQRLKGRLSQPWHTKRAAKEGDMYWLRLAGSYQGN